MKGLIIIIVLLAILGIWWAKRTPDTVGTYEPESANTINAGVDLNGSIDGSGAVNGSDNEEIEGDKG